MNWENDYSRSESLVRYGKENYEGVKEFLDRHPKTGNPKVTLNKNSTLYSTPEGIISLRKEGFVYVTKDNPIRKDLMRKIEELEKLKEGVEF